MEPKYEDEVGIDGCHGFGWVPDKNSGNYQTTLGDYGIKIEKKPVPAREERDEKDLDTILQEALETAPSIEGYTIRQLSDVINSPWHPIRGWHIERLEALGIVDELGAKIYRKRKRRN